MLLLDIDGELRCEVDRDKRGSSLERKFEHWQNLLLRRIRTAKGFSKGNLIILELELELELLGFHAGEIFPRIKSYSWEKSYSKMRRDLIV